MSASSLFMKYYNWYRNILILFLISSSVFFLWILLVQKENRNEIYSDFLLKKYLFKEKDLGVESKDLVDNNLIDLGIILNINTLEKARQIDLLESILKKKNYSQLVQNISEFLYSYIIINNSLAHTEILDNIFQNLDEEHIYFIDMYLLKGIYYIQNNNLDEAGSIFHYLSILYQYDNKIFTKIDPLILEAFKSYIGEQKL